MVSWVALGVGTAGWEVSVKGELSTVYRKDTAGTTVYSKVIVFSDNLIIFKNAKRAHINVLIVEVLTSNCSLNEIMYNINIMCIKGQIYKCNAHVLQSEYILMFSLWKC